MNVQPQERDWAKIGLRAALILALLLLVAVVGGWIFFSTTAGSDVAAAVRARFNDLDRTLASDDTVRKAFVLTAFPLLGLFPASAFLLAVGWTSEGRAWLRTHAPFAVMILVTFVGFGCLRLAGVVVLTDAQATWALAGLGVFVGTSIAMFAVVVRRILRERSAALEWGMVPVVFRAWLALVTVAALAMWLAVLFDVMQLN